MNTIIEHKSKCYIKSETGYREIIATTDSSLTVPYMGISGKQREVGGVNQVKHISFIPQSFISLYIEEYNKGNKIEGVEVEYEDQSYCSIGKVDCYRHNHNNVDCEICTSDSKNSPKIKISSDNTINIKQLKDSWNREEVLLLCSLAYNEGENYGYESSPIEPDIHQHKRFDEWIEENL